MSVKVHEAFSIDSFQDRLLFSDDFLGAVLRDLWRDGGDAGGSAAVVDGETGGVVRITTDTDTTDNWQLDWNTVRSLHVDKKVTFEARVKFSDNDTDILGYVGLLFDFGNRLIFEWSDVNANIQIVNSNGAANSRLDSGIARDTAYHIYRIECFPTGEIHYYIDGAETTNSPITTNIPSDAADYLQPFFWVRTLEDGVAKSMDVDYCVVRQEI